MRFGILQGYPRLRRYFGRVADYIALLRPFTLLPPLLVGLFGSALCLGPALWGRWREAIYVALTLTLCQAIGQCVNQATGVEEDRINKPYRPIPSGRLTVEEAFGVAFLLSLVAVGRAFTVNPSFGLWILTLLFFALFYNLKPLEIKRRLWLNLLWMSVSRGLLPLPVIWSAYANPWMPKPWIIGSVCYTWCLAFQNTKDLGDIPGDSKYGIRTLPVVYGREWTQGFIKKISWFSILLPFLYIYLGLLPASYYILALGLLAMREIGVRGFDRKTEWFENDLSWLAYYMGLGLIYILASTAELLIF